MYIKRLQIASSDVKKGGEEKNGWLNEKSLAILPGGRVFASCQHRHYFKGGHVRHLAKDIFVFFLYLLFFFLRADVNTEEPNSSIITPVRHNRMNLLLCTGPFIFFLGSFPLFSLPSSFLGV